MSTRVPLRLLLVEDSEDDAELILMELERAGFMLQCRRLETEEEFVSALDEEGWDIIISDFQMPQFDGLRAFSIYKDRGIDTPFIFVSGALGEDRAVEAMRAGARDYLLKGNLARLTVAVHRELEEAKNRSAQRMAEEATRREQRRLAVAVEASGAGVFEHQVPLRADTYVSERLAEIVGYPMDELPPFEHALEWAKDLVHPEDLLVVQGEYTAFVRGEVARYGAEFRVRHKAGHARGRRAARPHGAAPPRGAAATGAEDGGRGPLGGRRGARLQQSAHGDLQLRQLRARRAAARGSGLSRHARGAEGGQACRGPHVAAARVLAAQASVAQGAQHQHARQRHGSHAAARGR
jgi:CheY-like chemotaxis protein